MSLAYHCISLPYPSISLLYPFISLPYPFISLLYPFISLLYPFTSLLYPFTSLLYPFISLPYPFISLPHSGNYASHGLYHQQHNRSAEGSATVTIEHKALPEHTAHAHSLEVCFLSQTYRSSANHEGCRREPICVSAPAQTPNGLP